MLYNENMERDQHIRLTGKTRHGKNRIHQHGDIWLVVSEGKFQGQDAWNLRSLALTEGPRDAKVHDGRWVLKLNDPNFNWEITNG